MDVLVVGAGAMGAWFGRAVDGVADVAYADRDRAVAEAAAAATGGTVAPLDGDERYDAVCLAVPMPAVADAVAAHADRAERALVDVAGVMAAPVAAMADAAPDRERVSLHPLFAPANEPGTVAVVPDAAGPVTDELRGAVAARGNDLFETTPAEHDAAMESVQAAAHAAVLAYGLATEDVRAAFHTPVSETLADLVAQVTGGEPRVYADVHATFEGADALAEAARELAEVDREAFTELYAAAREGPAGATAGGLERAAGTGPGAAGDEREDADDG